MCTGSSIQQNLKPYGVSLIPLIVIKYIRINLVTTAAHTPLRYVQVHSESLKTKSFLLEIPGTIVQACLFSVHDDNVAMEVVDTVNASTVRSAVAIKSHVDRCGKEAAICDDTSCHLWYCIVVKAGICANTESLVFRSLSQNNPVNRIKVDCPTSVINSFVSLTKRIQGLLPAVSSQIASLQQF
jgi:hypothetical protein